MNEFRTWLRSGTPWVWLTAAALAACMLLVIGLLMLITWRGMGHFWPHPVQEIVYQGESGQRITLAGVIREREEVSAQRLVESGIDLPSQDSETVERILLKTGNRDVTGQDFNWILAPFILKQTQPVSMVALEREEWGTFFGRVLDLKRDGVSVRSLDPWGDFQDAVQRASVLREQIHDLERKEIGRVNYRLERLRLAERKLELREETELEAFAAIERDREVLQAEYAVMEQRLGELNEEIRRYSVVMETAGGQEVELNLDGIIDAWKPNAMKLPAQLVHYAAKALSFITDEPREANTEGGIFPAIFGTILMVLVMTVVVTPFGVVAGVYMKEYAKQRAAEIDPRNPAFKACVLLLSSTTCATTAARRSPVDLRGTWTLSWRPSCPWPYP